MHELPERLLVERPQAYPGASERMDPGEVDPAVVRSLGTVYVPLLVLLYLAFVACLLGYRIDRRQHEENLRRLAETVHVAMASGPAPTPGSGRCEHLPSCAAAFTWK